MGVDASLTGVPEFDKLEVVKTGDIEITKSASTIQTLTNVAHNLGYIPIVLVFQGSGTQGALPFLSLRGSGTNAGSIQTLNYISAISDTNFTIQIVCPNYAANTDFSQAVTYSFKYYLLRHTAN